MLASRQAVLFKVAKLLPLLTPSWRAALAAFGLAVLVPMGAGLAQESESATERAETTNDAAARVAKLEAEIAALRIMVGALEAAVRARPSLPPDGASFAPDTESPDDLKARVRALEVQIGALTDQMDSFLGRLDEMSAAKSADKTPPKPKVAAPKPKVAAPEPKPEHANEEAAKKEAAKPATTLTDPEPRPRAAKTPEPKGPETQAAEPKVPAPKITAPDRKPPREVADAAPESEADAPVPPSLAPVVPPAIENADPSKPRWYGARPDPGQSGSATSSDLAVGSLPDTPPRRLAAYPAKEAQALYEQGYGDYLRRDYAGAEAAFRKLVTAYPNDPLAGGAQYWVGETQYLRKQYQKAADSFLNGYRQYSGSDKAPDTLLRLGMSLAALGKTSAACATFKKLGDRFPNSSQQNQAKAAAGKAGCQ